MCKAWIRQNIDWKKGCRKFSGMMKAFCILIVMTFIQIWLVYGKSNTYLQPSLPHLTPLQILHHVLAQTNRSVDSYDQLDKSRMLLQDSGKVSASLIQEINITEAAKTPHLSALNTEMIPTGMAIIKQSWGKEQKIHKDTVEQLYQN